AIANKVVDFPQPEGPSSVRNSPSRTVRSMLSIARTSPKCLDRDSIVRSTIAVGPQHDAGKKNEDHGYSELNNRQCRNRACVTNATEAQHRADDHLHTRPKHEYSR